MRTRKGDIEPPALIKLVLKLSGWKWSLMAIAPVNDEPEVLIVIGRKYDSEQITAHNTPAEGKGSHR